MWAVVVSVLRRSLFMKPWMSGLAGLVFAIGVTSACERRERAALPAPAATPDPCVAALAPGPEQRDVDRAIAGAQQDARGGTQAKAALERLGFLFVARARVSNDPGDYKLAEMAAACLEARHPGEAAALLLKGHVLHQLHRFREAEQAARALVARRTVVLDYGLLGDALMEQGRLAEAAEAYQKMLDLKPYYQSYTRAAHLRWLKGDLDGAIEVIRLAIASASPRDPESSAWAWTRLAAYQLQAGRLADATTAIESALRHQPEYAPALLAHGKVHLAMQRPSAAVEVLRRAARVNPLPEYQWALADALRLQGLDADASAVEQELTARGSDDPRTFALYLATRRVNAPKALALAEEELRARADVFTLDAHAWALAASGRTAEAHEVMARALSEGTQDARLFLHAGVIHAAAGRHREARGWLKKAEHLRAMLLPSESAELARRMTKNPITEEN
jgi:tetratricopeptide (TPR) repeat protein